MLSKYILPVLAVVGILLGVYSVVSGRQPQAIAQPAAQPAESPFPAYIAGAGIVEASTRNIAIGTALSGLVTKVVVQVGDHVRAGTPLFYLDDRDVVAELGIKRADLAKAKAGVLEAEANMTDAASVLNLAEAVTDKRAISTEELTRRRNALLIARARLENARAQVQQAEAAVAAVQTTLERLIVRAPVDGDILQVNLRAGEFAATGALSTPLLVMGNLDQFHVRVDIDENDAWRFRADGKAIAFLRGNRQFSTDLTLAYVEPYVVPKKSLTGDSTERVDTRVLQAVYRFARGSLPVYVGQQMDVFIESREDANRAHSAAAQRGDAP